MTSRLCFLPQVVVVGVVGRGHLQTTRSEFTVHIVVLNDGDAAPGNGDNGPLAMQMDKPFIFGVDANGAVRENGFRTGCGDGEPVLGAFDLVASRSEDWIAPRCATLLRR